MIWILKGSETKCDFITPHNFDEFLVLYQQNVGRISSYVKIISLELKDFIHYHIEREYMLYSSTKIYYY